MKESPRGSSGAVHARRSPQEESPEDTEPEAESPGHVPSLPTADANTSYTLASETGTAGADGAGVVDVTPLEHTLRLPPAFSEEMPEVREISVAEAAVTEKDGAKRSGKKRGRSEKTADEEGKEEDASTHPKFTGRDGKFYWSKCRCLLRSFRVGGFQVYCSAV